MAASAPRRFALPWPPSGNSHWRTLKGRIILSAKTRAWRDAVAAAIAHQRVEGDALLGRLQLDLIAHPPDRRRRDLSNVVKETEDALTRSGVIVDDSLIDDLRVRRGEIVAGGMIEVRVAELRSEGSE